MGLITGPPPGIAVKIKWDVYKATSSVPRNKHNNNDNNSNGGK